ncbi:MAG: hypothetical protein J5I59_00140 [Saprospiraceae bacterium]|nr:hypothetical protein [Saprospiraceae bacterium]
MKILTLFITVLFISTAGYGQVAKSLSQKPDPNKKLMTVDASCGECNFDLEGHSCDLAVKIDGKAYYVDGVGIDAFGHPHDKNGFCVAVRKAEVQGEVVNDRFKASYFKLLKPEKNKGKK